MAIEVRLASEYWSKEKDKCHDSPQSPIDSPKTNELGNQDLSEELKLPERGTPCDVNVEKQQTSGHKKSASEGGTPDNAKINSQEKILLPIRKLAPVAEEFDPSDPFRVYNFVPTLVSSGHFMR